MSTNSKQRSQEIYTAAVALVEPVDVSEAVEIRLLAHDLEKLTGCHYETAKRHIAKAIRRKRYGIMQEYQNWGGAREGAGYPKGEPRKAE